MNDTSQIVKSKLPNTGTSIFAVMTKLAKENNAVNLSQGFPDFPVSEELISMVNKYMKSGFNQYAPMPGIFELRTAISEMFKENHGVEYNPNTEINVVAEKIVIDSVKKIIKTGKCLALIPIIGFCPRTYKIFFIPIFSLVMYGVDY